MKLKELDELLRSELRGYEVPWKQVGGWPRDASGHFHPLPYYAWLALAVRALKPKHILELGAWKGASTFAMWWEAEPGTRVTSVDIAPDWEYVPDDMRADPGFRMISGSSDDPKTFEGIYDVDFLFVDSEHRGPYALREWELAKKILLPGAFVCYDDIHHADMDLWWDTIACEKLDAGDVCHPQTGWGFFFWNP